ncbi:MAG TPA: type II toxin-antitoxin system RelE/ParE family toxin [Verrucomicrobiae bacterium]|nr:type II toxin-antitoxin system RelE/ParE family toxin [Verrucomicrobiae bacterium]
MSQFLLAPAARSDILEIWNYYASEVGNAELADRMRDEIFKGIRAAARKPGIGHLRHDLADESLRFWRVRKYLIIYRSQSKPIQVVRVLHGARDVHALLGEG